MPTGHTLLAFALVSLGITVIPGPSNLFILAQGVAHGRRGAIAAMGGIEMASAIRVLATAAGLSAMLELAWVSRRPSKEDDLSSGEEILQRCHVPGSIRRS